MRSPTNYERLHSEDVLPHEIVTVTKAIILRIRPSDLYARAAVRADGSTLGLLARSRPQYVVYLPDPFILLNTDVPQQACTQQHFMRGLQHAL